jgi:NAD-dependent dihydropyrimidine dehydrogenase PreA subunit
MQQNSEKYTIELVHELGGLLAENRRLQQELLPPQLRESTVEVPLAEVCDADVSKGGSDPADSWPCGSSHNMCQTCGFCERHCICPF